MGWFDALCWSYAVVMASWLAWASAATARWVLTRNRADRPGHGGGGFSSHSTAQYTPRSAAFTERSTGSR